VVLHPGLLYAGGGLLLIGFAFKVAAVPFHAWSPDVYEGAPTPVTGVMASIVKVGAFAALLRVIVSALGTQLDTWRPILFVLVILTCVVGASVALVQRNVKRLLAYSSINQAGFMLLGVWAGTARGVAGTLFYVLTYAPIVIATFAIITLVGGKGDEHHSIDHYRGLARRQPWLGGALAALLLTQLGAPLTVGFYAKFTVLAATIDAGGGALALVALLSAAIAAYFYLRFALTLYADDDVEGTRIHVPMLTGTTIAVGVIVAILFGLWPGPLAAWVQHATLLFLP
jgi:NADH-quinone oxidoreductase subunit N